MIRIADLESIGRTMYGHALSAGAVAWGRLPAEVKRAEYARIESLGHSKHQIANKWIKRHALAHAIESVAIGVKFELLQDVVWWPLPNANTSPGEFDVEDAEVRSVLINAKGLADRYGQAERIVLWHTHFKSLEPSAEDLAMLKKNTWLAEGILFHAPTGQSVRYNAKGNAYAVAPNSAINFDPSSTPQGPSRGQVL